MRTFSRRMLISFTWMALIVAAGCGGDDKGNGNGGDGGNTQRDSVPITKGTWHVVTTTTPGATCDMQASTDEVTEALCDLAPDFSDVPGTINCNITKDGNNFSFTCDGSFAVSGTPCTVVVSVSGGGSVGNGGKSYDTTATVATHLTGPGLCTSAPPCTLGIHETGTWVNGTATCDTTKAINSSVTGALHHTIARLVGAL